MKTRMVVAMLVIAVGIGVSFGYVLIPARAANGSVSETSEDSLVSEMRALRDEMSLLRSDIQGLRTQLTGGTDETTNPEAESQGSGSNKLRIVFTKVPGPGGGGDSRGDIAGKVLGLSKPEKYKIVLYARTDVWYVQPLISDPYTSIGADGKWSNWTHLGTTYAALLARPSFEPPAKADSLPAVGGDVLAAAKTPAS